MLIDSKFHLDCDIIEENDDDSEDENRNISDNKLLNFAKVAKSSIADEDDLACNNISTEIITRWVDDTLSAAVVLVAGGLDKVKSFFCYL
jgi:hypothetical protein